MLWFLVGLLAGFLDYTFALGFGLISSIILIGIMGFDVKEVIPIVTASQVITSVPVFLMHLRVGNVKSKPPRELLNFVVLSSLFAFLIPALIVQLPRDVRQVLYLIVLASLPVIIKVRVRNSLIYSLIAGLDKAIVGGGLSLIIVSMEMSLGIDLRSAIALMPIVKLLPTLSTAVSYSVIAGLDPFKVVYMSVGALIASIISSRVLKRVRLSENTLTIMVLAVIVLNLIKFVTVR